MRKSPHPSVRNDHMRFLAWTLSDGIPPNPVVSQLNCTNTVLLEFE